MKHLNLFLICVYLLFAHFGLSQIELEKVRSEVYEEIMNYEMDSNLVQIDSDVVYWNQVDTFKFVGYNSAIRGVHRLDTLHISLYFESEWSEFRIDETKKRNTERIAPLKETYLSYMDSIGWRGYKISRSSFEADVVKHLKMKYPVAFTEEERDKIDAIQRCPDFLVGDVGVFLDCDFSGIYPENVRDTYLSRLSFISQGIFQLEKVNFGQKHLYK